MDKIKVIVFLKSLCGGGAERTIINIINNIDKNRFSVILVLGSNLNNTYIDLVSNDIRIIYLNKSRSLKCIFPIRKILIKEKPDLAFSTLTYSNIILLTANLLTCLKTPVIVREASHLSSQKEIIGFKKMVTSLFYNFLAVKIVSLSCGVKTDLVKNYKINADKIEVIYNPVDIDRINILKNEKIEAISKDSDEKVIISIGRLEPEKDFFTLIKAFKIIQSSMSSRLIILGQGSLSDDLKAYCKENQIEDKVSFEGFQLNPYKYLRNSDIFILTSKYEGFGHVIVEAMATGVPVIVTNCPSGPIEIIKDNQYGRLVNIGDYQQIATEAINLFKNNQLIDEYKRKGLERAENFNAKTIVRQYEQLFFKTIKHKDYNNFRSQFSRRKL